MRFMYNSALQGLRAVKQYIHEIAFGAHDIVQVAGSSCVRLALQVVAAVANKLVSVFDGTTQYHLGRWSLAKRGGSGWPPLDACFFGFESAVAAATCHFPSTSRQLRAPRVLLQLEVKGKAYWCHQKGMWAFSAVRPVLIVSDTTQGRSFIVPSRLLHGSTPGAGASLAHA